MKTEPGDSEQVPGHPTSVHQGLCRQRAMEQLLSDRDYKNKEMQKKAKQTQQVTRALCQRKHLRSKVPQDRMKSEQIKHWLN